MIGVNRQGSTRRADRPMSRIKRDSRVPGMFGGPAQQPDCRSDGESRSQQRMSKKIAVHSAPKCSSACAVDNRRCHPVAIRVPNCQRSVCFLRWRPVLFPGCGQLGRPNCDQIVSHLVGWSGQHSHVWPRQDWMPSQIAAPAMPSPMTGSIHQAPGQAAVMVRPASTAAAWAAQR